MVHTAASSASCRLGLYSLEFRRMRGDLIETYKIMKGIDKIEARELFPLAGETRPRGHGLKIRGSRFRTELRRNFFTQRVVNVWNSLPSEAVEATSLDVFKARIEKFLNSQGIKGYGEWAVSGAESMKRSAMVLLNGGAGSRGQMADSCS